MRFPLCLWLLWKIKFSLELFWKLNLHFFNSFSMAPAVLFCKHLLRSHMRLAFSYVKNLFSWPLAGSSDPMGWFTPLKVLSTIFITNWRASQKDLIQQCDLKLIVTRLTLISTGTKQYNIGPFAKDSPISAPERCAVQYSCPWASRESNSIARVKMESRLLD